MPATIIVPYAEFDSSLNTKILATHNVRLLRHIEHNMAEVKVYRKIDENLHAFLLIIHAEGEGLMMYEIP
jgi:hypothetical protein